MLNQACLIRLGLRRENRKKKKKEKGEEEGGEKRKENPGKRCHISERNSSAAEKTLRNRFGVNH